MRSFGLLLVTGLILLTSVFVFFFFVRSLTSRVMLLGTTNLRVDKNALTSWLSLIDEYKVNNQYLVIISKKGRPILGEMQLTQSLTDDNFTDPTFGCEWRESLLWGKLRILNVVLEQSRYNDQEKILTLNKGMLACIENVYMIGASEEATEPLLNRMLEKLNSGDKLPFKI